jgi:prevent-host-death family protein
MLVQRMSAKEVRTNFSDVLGRAYYKGEPTIVEKQGKPVAVVISSEEYEQFRRYKEQAKQRFFEVVDRIQERNADKDPEEVYQDVTAAVEEVRQEAYGKPS